MSHYKKKTAKSIPVKISKLYPTNIWITMKMKKKINIRAEIKRMDGNMRRAFLAIECNTNKLNLLDDARKRVDVLEQLPEFKKWKRLEERERQLWKAKNGLSDRLKILLEDFPEEQKKLVDSITEVLPLTEAGPVTALRIIDIIKGFSC